ncbi:MAG: hypothetical protein RLZZ584_3986 [Pseudomonadota bacterium]
MAHVDLEIEAGEFCVFVGPSGCGKSTLLRMVAGLETITEGELSIAGRRMNELPPAERGVAMVFQSYALYPHMTVYDNMAFGLQVQGVAKAETDRKVREAAAILQLGHLLDRMPRALSGGQRQRVAIGRAIVKQPQVFLFDEPLSNLDAALRAQTRIEIARLHREMGSASMIYVTHDQIEAMTLAQKIVLLHAGEDIARHGSVAQVGSPMALYHRPASLFVAEFIGSPRINVLPARLLAAEADHATVTLGAGAAGAATGAVAPAWADVPVRVAVDARHLAVGSAVSLAVRPEHLLLAGGMAGSDNAALATLEAPVAHVERLGESSILYLDAGQPAPLALRVEGHADQAVGQRVPLGLRPEALHLFDADGRACRRTVTLPA